MQTLCKRTNSSLLNTDLFTIVEQTYVTCRLHHTKAMVGRILIFLLCVWCSLDAGRLLMVVTAQPTVSAMILTPCADRKEGGQVDMRCTAINLESDHIVEWFTDTPRMTLAWNMSIVSTNPRFMFTTTHPQTGTTIQDFTITDLQRNDTDAYLCTVNDPILTGGSLIVATSRRIPISVLLPQRVIPCVLPCWTHYSRQWNSDTYAMFI